MRSLSGSMRHSRDILYAVGSKSKAEVGPMTFHPNEVVSQHAKYYTRSYESTSPSLGFLPRVNVRGWSAGMRHHM